MGLVKYQKILSLASWPSCYLYNSNCLVNNWRIISWAGLPVGVLVTIRICGFSEIQKNLSLASWPSCYLYNSKYLVKNWRILSVAGLPVGVRFNIRIYGFSENTKKFSVWLVGLVVTFSIQSVWWKAEQFSVWMVCQLTYVSPLEFVGLVKTKTFSVWIVGLQ